LFGGRLEAAHRLLRHQKTYTFLVKRLFNKKSFEKFSFLLRLRCGLWLVGTDHPADPQLQTSPQSVPCHVTGLDGLGQRLSSVKTYLQGQIKALSGKQDQTMAAQAAMQEHLSHVGVDVENTHAEVSEV